MDAANDTIAAIATAPGEGAISIVRVSGPAALAIADRIVVCAGAKPSQRAGGTFLHGTLRAKGPEATAVMVDEVIVLIYRAPHSYTREDAVEFQGHGGAVAARRILRAALDAGARTALPGEFTQRAFLNGRIDLLQAEAVLDLIRARSERAAAAAIEQLSGSLSRLTNDIYDTLLGVAADMEATLDFPDDELPEATMEGLRRQLDEVKRGVEGILATWDEGHLLREGASVAILGRPNVGKSTLLNALLGTSRAIVTEVPGTTRDVVEETLVLDGVPLRLSDTAGLRDTDCRIEGEGIRRARVLMERADYVLYVLDASDALTEEDRLNMGNLDPKRTVLILNKCDCAVRIRASDLMGWQCVHTSLTRNEGLDAAKAALSDRLALGHGTQAHAVIGERHRGLVDKALACVVEAIQLMDEGPLDATLVAAQVRSAVESLGQITGREYYEELLNSIFSRFCIGK